MVRREDRAGGHIYCRSCGGEYALGLGAAGEVRLAPTGRIGSARDLQPAADSALIARFVAETARRAALPALLASAGG